MTPKEKAESLLNKFIVEGCLFANAKKCALITVEEIIKSLIEFDEILDIYIPVSDEIDFWNQVIIEINKL